MPAHVSICENDDALIVHSRTMKMMIDGEFVVCCIGMASKISNAIGLFNFHNSLRNKQRKS